MNQSNNHNWYIGGYSGGHIIPLITLIQNDNDAHAILFIPDDEYIRKIIDKKNINIKTYFYQKPKKKLIKIIYFIICTVKLTIQICKKAIFNRPNKIISSGGFFSFPFFFVSKMLCIPFHIYHFDCIPGKAARFMAWCPRLKNPVYEYYLYEKTIAYCQKKNIIISTKYPIRFAEKDIIDTKSAKLKLGFDINKMVILILGGSQGSDQLNQICIDTFLTLSQKHEYHIIHQTGKNDILAIQTFYQENNIDHTVFHFQTDLRLFFNAADVILCRCGAGTLAEVEFFKKPALLFPLINMANNHQVQNALAMNEKNQMYQIYTTKKEMLVFILQYKP